MNNVQKTNDFIIHETFDNSSLTSAIHHFCHDCHNELHVIVSEYCNLIGLTVVTCPLLIESLPDHSHSLMGLTLLYKHKSCDLVT